MERLFIKGTGRAVIIYEGLNIFVGYDVGQCFLPESINAPDLDSSQPLDRLVWDISILVDSFAHRQQQIKEIEVDFPNGIDFYESVSCLI